MSDGRAGAAPRAVVDPIRRFWAAARRADPTLPPDPPPADALGGTPEEADALLALVLAGRKTATSSAADDYAAAGAPLPHVGDLSILLDGVGRPRAVVEVSDVVVVPFDEVGAEHAGAEGEGDRSQAAWRAEHERFWRAHAVGGFLPTMPVVCEQFRVRWASTSP